MPELDPSESPFRLEVSLPDGTSKVLYEPSTKQLEFHNSDITNLIAIGNRGGGKSLMLRFDAHMRALSVPESMLILVRRSFPELTKALALDTLVATPEGFVPIGYLKVGDMVITPTGETTKIIRTTKPFIDPKGTYRITFDNGEIVIAAGDHEWVTQTAQERSAEHRLLSGLQDTIRLDFKAKPRTTEEIYKTLKVENGLRSNHSLAVAQAWDLQEKTLPVDPYVLGAWLGDGTRNQGAITSIDSEVLQQISTAGYTVRKRPAHKYEYGILKLKADLILAGVATNKHVPAIYLQSSAQQRLALLQGLMDTDGTVASGGLAVFTNTNIQLADAVHTLAASLGLKPRRSSRLSQLHGKLTGTTAYTVYWTSALPVFRLTRKLNKLRGKQKRATTGRHYITNCEKIPDMFCKCITVAHQSQQFLVSKSCIPTHNSHLIFIQQEMAFLGGDYHASNHIATYPNGSKLFFSHVASEGDALNLLSAEFLAAYFDELSTIPWEFFMKLCASVRVKKDSGHKAVVRAATNPLGPSAQEIYSYFVNRDVDPEEDADYIPSDWGSLRIQMEDNPHIDVDQYRRRLSSMPAHIRRAWLDGEFSLENQLFDFKPHKDGHEYHVIDSLPLIHGKPIIEEAW